MTSPSTRTPPASPDTRSDAELIRRSLHEPELFEQVFVRHVRAVFAFVAARVGPERAEDVTSDVFETAFQRRASFLPDASSARPWLYGIAANKLHHHRHAERRWLELGERAFVELPAEFDADASAARLDARRRLPALLDALAQLTEAERDVLVLHVLAGLTHTEIAAALGIRRGAAKVRLSRGRARLRAALDGLTDHDHEEGGTDD